MTPKQYRAALDRLGLSIRRAGLLWATPCTSQRWADGKSPIPKAVVFIIDILEAAPGMIEYYRDPQPITGTDD